MSIFHTLFWCFYLSLWTSKCQLGWSSHLHEKEQEHLISFYKDLPVLPIPDISIKKPSLNINPMYPWWYVFFVYVCRCLLQLLEIFRCGLKREKWKLLIAFPAGLYLLKVNNRNTRPRFKICSKVTIILNIYHTLF